MPSPAHDNPARALIGALAFAARVAAVLLVALTVANIFATGAVRAAILPLTTWLGRLVPEGLAGSLVFRTPFGGAFRGDFAVLAVGLFVLDWLLSKLSSAFK